jgi:protein-S-isoprenylcysteine O-methyltransferase Ste14
MARSRLDPRMLLVIMVSMAVFIVLPYWAWGSWSGLLGHPARLGVFVVMIASLVAFFFSRIDFSSFDWDDPRTRAVMPISIVVTLPIAFLPSYADRLGYLVWDGDWVRYMGLVLYTAGTLLRIGPMFQLGNRFRAPWTAQKEHRLVTTGFYRYVRHPSYLGVFLMLMGWFLVFRCWIGLVLCLVLVPVAIAPLRKEESKLYEEFGEAYSAYRKRTWLLPFIR